MAKICELCGKSAQYGNNVSHSKRHTKRRWLANIHPASISLKGKLLRLYLCTRCLRTLQRSAT